MIIKNFKIVWALIIGIGALIPLYLELPIIIGDIFGMNINGGISLILCFVIGIIVALIINYCRSTSKVKEIISLYKPLKQPISWNYENFLGLTRRNEEKPYISNFQIRGECLKATNINNCYIKSMTTGQVIKVEFNTGNSYAKAGELNEIPKGATVNARALFWDPDNHTLPREGITEDQFLEDWGGIEFYIDYSIGKSFKKCFDINEIQKQIDLVKPAKKFNPRVTAKAV